MLIASTSLPDNAGYVVAAYLVFVALLLIYVAIMAYKLIALRRDVTELDALTDRDDDADRERQAPRTGAGASVSR